MTAAAIIGGMALATSGLALAQSSTAPPNMPPSSASPSMKTPEMIPSPGATNPSGMNNPSESTGPSAASTPSESDADSPQDIRQAQEKLRAHGLYHGAIDGQMGPETKAALAEFQQQNGLPQSSTLDEATLAKLNGGAGNAMPNSGSSNPPASMSPTINPSTGSSSGGTVGPTTPETIPASPGGATGH
ncbi:MAG TPA: peptidoglycan-binding protein [Stellaceae bacterium]|nr:peptidoglycan-binding protein [Stellaceae bacterium]